MSRLRPLLHTWIFLLVGSGYLGSLPGVAPWLIASGLNHGHDHHVEVVQQAGQSHLVFHHDHDDHHDDSHAPEWHLSDSEQPHDCHVVNLPTDAASTLLPPNALPLLALRDFTLAPSQQPHFTGWEGSAIAPFARPPPLSASAVLGCLRSIVLRI